MHKVRYILIISGIFGLLLFLLFMFLSRPSTKNDGIKYLIGVSQPNNSDPWRIYMNQLMREEAANYLSVKVQFYDAADDDINQKRDIEKLIEQKVDLLIVYPNNGKFLSEIVSSVYKNGIPVIVMGNVIGAEDYTMLIYSDNYKIGRQAGEFVVKMLGDKGGTILEVQGSPDSTITKERKEGFRDAIKGFSKIKIEYVVVGYWLRDLTEERVREIYKKEPKVDVVFAHNDSMAIGAWRVSANERINARFIGIEGLPGKNGGLEAVNNGLLEGTIIYPTGGREAIINALKILKGETVPKRIEIPATIVTKDNIKQFIK